ncbi:MULTISPECIES: hypothetical protein [unclassified Acinetobacter]|uniref:hypothetical protein n=1 Tax=unclassified Acinetobacter TaxID=196816 RepID=UPI0018ED27CE|nr:MULTISPECIES: hypothetical protein [unclassified Acinetobacter]MBJ6351115.1 hypothetical protein [Acinetobacter sp. c1]MBM0956741.1 hypothetical protein [Acinetobacter sp. C13]
MYLFSKKKISLKNIRGKIFELYDINYFTYSELKAKVVKLTNKIYRVHLELEYGTLIVLLDQWNFFKLEIYSKKREIPFRKVTD